LTQSLQCSAAHCRTNITVTFIHFRLQARYKSSTKGRVPVQALYGRYLREFCAPDRREPQRKCEVGKIVKKAFPGVKNRRLGSLGHQQSYYCGIIECARDSAAQEEEEDDRNQESSRNPSSPGSPACRKRERDESKRVTESKRVKSSASYPFIPVPEGPTMVSGPEGSFSCCLDASLDLGLPTLGGFIHAVLNSRPLPTISLDGCSSPPACIRKCAW